MTIRHYPDRDHLATTLAGVVTEEIRLILADQARAVLSLPGGSTPGPFLAALARQDLPWARVTLTLNDERWVPPDHPRSNAAQLCRAMAPALQAGAAFWPLYKEGVDPDEGAELLCQMADFPGLDLVVLGMGTDGHTASLFPEGDQLTLALSDHAPMLLPMVAPGADEPRMTFSLPALTQARFRHLLITGASKKDVLAKARDAGPVQEMPIRGMLEKEGLVIHYAD